MPDGTIKGNCDADLVFKAMFDFYETGYDEAVIVASDGDYKSLVEHLKATGKLRRVIGCSWGSCARKLLALRSTSWITSDPKWSINKEEEPHKD